MKWIIWPPKPYLHPSWGNRRSVWGWSFKPVNVSGTFEVRWIFTSLAHNEVRTKLHNKVHHLLNKAWQCNIRHCRQLYIVYLHNSEYNYSLCSVLTVFPPTDGNSLAIWLPSVTNCSSKTRRGKSPHSWQWDKERCELVGACCVPHVWPTDPVWTTCRWRYHLSGK